MADHVVEAGLDIAFEMPVEYTSEELVALAELVGADRFPGLGKPLLPDLSEDARAAVIQSAEVALRAHGVIDVTEEGDVGFVAPHSSILALVFAPGLCVLANRIDDDGPRQVIWYARPQLTVEHTRVTERIHRFQLIETEGLFQRLIDFVELEHRPEISEREFVLTGHQLERLELLVDAGDRAAARAELYDVPESFLEASFARVRMGQVTTMYRKDDVEYGGDLMWVDGGGNGIWSLHVSHPADGEHAVDRVTIEPVSADAIIESLLSSLPGAEG